MTIPKNASPVHHGLRPLGPYGEGYCRVCHFVQALTFDGLIERHSRGALLDGPAECKGSFTKAPKITPFASRKAMFRLKAPDAWCPECKRFVRSVTRGGVPVYARHSSVAAPWMCPYTMHRVEQAQPDAARPAERDQSNTRGRGLADRPPWAYYGGSYRL